MALPLSFDLPEDLVAEIFQYLSPHDATLVCNSWHCWFWKYGTVAKVDLSMVGVKMRLPENQSTRSAVRFVRGCYHVFSRALKIVADTSSIGLLHDMVLSKCEVLRFEDRTIIQYWKPNAVLTRSVVPSLRRIEGQIRSDLASDVICPALMDSVDTSDLTAYIWPLPDDPDTLQDAVVPGYTHCEFDVPEYCVYKCVDLINKTIRAPNWRCTLATHPEFLDYAMLRLLMECNRVSAIVYMVPCLDLKSFLQALIKKLPKGDAFATSKNCLIKTNAPLDERNAAYVNSAKAVAMTVGIVLQVKFDMFI